MKNAMKDGVGPDTTATVSPQQKHVFEASVFRAGESWCVGRQRLKFTEKSAACSGAHQRRELPCVCVGVCVWGDSSSSPSRGSFQGTWDNPSSATSAPHLSALLTLPLTSLLSVWQVFIAVVSVYRDLPLGALELS